MNSKTHWENIHAQKEPQSLTWFQETPATTLRMLESAGATPQAALIDVGGGASNLVDHLLANGYENVTVLDIASGALSRSRDRLGAADQKVRWICADVLEATLPQAYDVWHDRAVFHFLTDADDRRRYANQLFDSLIPGGYAIISTFAEDGPDRCSGLSCMRYSPTTLQAELGTDRFRLVESARETHVTPQEQEQRFQYSLLQRLP